MALDSGEKEKFAAWYQLYGGAVIALVRKRMTERARLQGATSTSVVAQSVWRSFIEHHKDEVDLNDDQSALVLLLRLACKHTNTLDHRAKGRPSSTSLDLPIGNDPDGVPYGAMVADETELPAEIQAMLNEFCDLLMDSLDQPVEIQISPQSADRALSFVQRLNRLEKAVLALKLAGLGRRQVSLLLRSLEPGLNEYGVDRIWIAIRRKWEDADEG